MSAMSPLLAVMSFAISVSGAPSAGHFSYGNEQVHCHTLYNVQIEQKCHEEVDQKCHEEFDTVVDTHYVEECDDIVTQHCEQISTKVLHSSAIVGQQSYLATPGRGYEKRDAGRGIEYAGKPQCTAKKDRQCHKTPVQTARQIPRPVCVAVPRQVCVPYEVKIPYNTCGDSHVHVEQYTNDQVYAY